MEDLTRKTLRGCGGLSAGVEAGRCRGKAQTPSRKGGRESPAQPPQGNCPCGAGTEVVWKFEEIVAPSLRPQ